MQFFKIQRVASIEENELVVKMTLSLFAVCSLFNPDIWDLKLQFAVEFHKDA